jgi:hypothetical protein
MKRLMSAIMLCAFPLLTYAQSNPVTAAVRDTLQGRQKMIVEATQEMPPDKYGQTDPPARFKSPHKRRAERLQQVADGVRVKRGPVVLWNRNHTLEDVGLKCRNNAHDCR